MSFSSHEKREKCTPSGCHNKSYSTQKQLGSSSSAGKCMDDDVCPDVWAKHT